MIKENHLVWYVCYGSNLLEERFLCYIRGGRIPGNTRSEIGAKDKSDPLAIRPCIIHHTLFFSHHAEKWDGSGVAFIDTEEDMSAASYGKMYLITKEQFLDVVRQENSLPMNCDISIDEAAVVKNKTCVLFENNYYGRLLYLGQTDGIPMYTFTCVSPMKEMTLTKPSGEYRRIIADGIKQTYGLDDKLIEEYLS
ncbi:MAG: hypothetical protein IJH07_08305 [Ruminococcus sp.]|nr:hypothetical protein [Ruminococcus sp.]